VGCFRQSDIDCEPLIAVLVLARCAGVLTPSQHVPEQYSSVFAAASAGDIPMLRHDIDADPSLLKATEWEGRTLLHDATDKSQLETVRYLLDRGSDIDAVTKDGRTALHMAAQRGDIAMMTLLLARGAPIDARDANGWTPLDRAVKWNRTEAATVLRAHGAHAQSQLSALLKPSAAAIVENTLFTLLRSGRQVGAGKAVKDRGDPPHSEGATHHTI
jgi:ankyrin repeat protein